MTDISIISSTRIRRKVSWEEGDCISVAPSFLSSSCAEVVPSGTSKIFGRVKQVLTNRLLIEWDIDETKNYVDINDQVTKERNDTERQVISEENCLSIISSDVDQVTEKSQDVSVSDLISNEEILDYCDLVVEKSPMKTASVITADDYQDPEQSTSSCQNPTQTSVLKERKCKPKTFSYESETEHHSDTNSTEPDSELEESCEKLRNLLPKRKVTRKCKPKRSAILGRSKNSKKAGQKRSIEKNDVVTKKSRF